MREALYKTYGAMKPVGAIAFCNTFGMLVFEPTKEDSYDCDYITAWSGTEKKAWGFHRNQLHYTTSGRAYLRKGNMRIYFDEVMRCS